RHGDPKTAGPVPQDPTACMHRASASDPFLALRPYWDLEVLLDAYVNVPPMSSGRAHSARIRLCHDHAPENRCAVLLRKEVIQPHLPVRLPCYDLVLITDPTFDGSLHKGWATGFGCYR